MVILTDLSDVLIGGVINAAQIVQARYGFCASLKCLERLRETKSDLNEVMRGNLKEEEYYRIFFAGSNFCFGYKDMSRIFSETFKITIPDTLKLYQRITAHPAYASDGAPVVFGMPDIYIVSDHIAGRVNEIKQYHPEIFRVAKDVFWSCDLGAVKGDPGFFEKILHSLNIKPNEAVFIDNDTRKVEAAKQAGIPSIRFVGAKVLEHELADLGFVIAPSTP